MKLEPFSLVCACPKCGMSNREFYYHKGTHQGGCTIRNKGSTNNECCTLEHMDIVCVKCKYGWAMEVKPPEHKHTPSGYSEGWTRCSECGVWMGLAPSPI
jgi:hypothetical protein